MNTENVEEISEEIAGVPDIFNRGDESIFDERDAFFDDDSMQ